jgi:protein phosphatase
VKLHEVAVLTHPGRVRRRNEDAFVCRPPLFVVADGMGGAQAGEIASRLAAAAFHDFHEADALDPEARLRAVIQEANRRIYSRSTSDPHASGMGTTATAALVSGRQVAVGHVGDSRLYRLRNGELDQITQDHSLVADLVRSGRLSPEEADTHPQRSVITRALGTDAAVTVDSFSVDAEPGDVYLLCSDGLTTMLPVGLVHETLTASATLEEAARRLVGAANEKGGEDNITVVLFSLTESNDDEDTLTGLEGFRIEMPSAPVEGDGKEGDTTIGPLPARETTGKIDMPRETRLARRWILLVVFAAILFGGLAAAAFFGLARAHFVGATKEGRVAVYQGVPWDLFAGIELYRERYVSQVQAVQLTAEERRELFDHDLMAEDAATARVTAFEEEVQIDL